jgi:Lrp/AsnC family transcriptional regulator
MPELDRIDRRILIELQADATMPIAQIAERVGLSQTPCWKRIRKLEASGVIERRVAVVDAAKVGLPLTVLTEVVALDHTPLWQEGFLRAVDAIPEIVEVMRLGGETDYLLRIVVPDIPAYDAIYRRLAGSVQFRSITSKFALETLRRRFVLPIRPD